MRTFGDVVWRIYGDAEGHYVDWEIKKAGWSLVGLWMMYSDIKSYMTRDSYGHALLLVRGEPLPILAEDVVSGMHGDYGRYIPCRFGAEPEPDRAKEQN